MIMFIVGYIVLLAGWTLFRVQKLWKVHHIREAVAYAGMMCLVIGLGSIIMADVHLPTFAILLIIPFKFLGIFLLS